MTAFILGAVILLGATWLALTLAESADDDGRPARRRVLGPTRQVVA